MRSPDRASRLMCLAFAFPLLLVCVASGCAGPGSGSKASIYEAAGAGDAARVRELLAADPKLANQPSPDGDFPLALAAGKGHAEVVRLLLAAGAQPDVHDDRMAPGPLELAVTGGFEQVARMLVEKGADVNAEARETDSFIKEHRGCSRTCADSALYREGWTPVHLAILRGHERLARFLAGRGARLDIDLAAALGMTEKVRAMLDADPRLANAPGPDLMPPLYWAAWAGQKEAAQLLLDRGADVNAVTRGPDELPPLGSRGETALHAAALNGRSDVAALLIARGADVSAENEACWTPLHHAAARGHRDVVELLLDKGADPNAEGCRPLSLAALGGHKEVVALLLRRGAEIDEGYPPPLHAAAGGGNRDVLAFLIDRGADVNDADPSFAPLHVAAQFGQTGAIELLISRGARVDEASPWRKWTPLHYAAAGARADAVRLLLAKGASVHAKTDDGRTALQLACSEPGRQRFEEVSDDANLLNDLAVPEPPTEADVLRTVEVLLASGAGVNEGERTPPLTLAAQAEQKGVVALLLDRGADPNVQSDWPETPLKTALRWDRLDIAEILAAKGARLDLAAAAALGKTAELAAMLKADPTLLKQLNDPATLPLMEAVEHGHADTVKLLLENGASLKALDGREYKVVGGREHVIAPLLEAAREGHVAVLNVLLDHGADPNAQDEDGWTPFKGAVRNQHLEAVELLVKRGANMDVGNSGGGKGLHLAVEHAGALPAAVARYLLARGALVDARDDDGDTPLHVAAGSDARESAELLLKHGADVNAKGKNGLTPLDHATFRGFAEMARILRAAGARDTAVSSLLLGDLDTARPLLAANPALARSNMPNGDSLVQCLVSDNRADSLGLVLQHRGDPSPKKDESGLPYLSGVAANAHADLARLLIRAGAEMNATGDAGPSAFSCVVNWGDLEIIRLCLDHGARLKLKNGTTESALLSATFRGDLRVAALLLDAGLDANAKDAEGETALHHAAMRGSRAVVALLLARGANVNATNAKAQTPLHVAMSYQRRGIAELIIARKPDVNAKDGGGETPLHLATASRASVKLLLEHGADVNAQDKYGRTPLDGASGGAAALLKKHGAAPGRE